MLDGQTAAASFPLTCVAATGTPRATGFWKHQIGIATGGNGNPAVDAATLCSYLDAVDAHFSDNALNSVSVFDVPSNATCAERLGLAKPLINATSPSLTAGWGSAGSGPGQFNYPTGIALDASGNVYVVDTENHRVQVFSSGGAFLRQWGSFGISNGQFKYPAGISVDANGYVYVSDRQNKLQKFLSDGTFVTKWGEDDGPPYYAGLLGPAGVEVTPAGDVLMCDNWQRELLRYTNTGTYLSKWWYLGGGSGFYVETEPQDVAVAANGDIYMLDGSPYTPQVVKLNSSGQFLARYWGWNGSPMWDPGNLSYPRSIALDSDGGWYIADAGNYRVQRFNSDGTLRDLWGTQGTDYGQFNWPQGIAVDASGDVYVVDSGNNRIQKFGPTGSPINLNGPPAPVDRAKQQLLALLLNVAANNLTLTNVISKDGATVSQAITFCDQIIDNPGGDHTLAIGILDKINSGQQVNAGLIPLTTEQIAYRGAMALRTFRVTPNPGPGARSFQFAMGRSGSVRLSVFDVSGRLVTKLVDGVMEAGEHSIAWRGTAERGSRIGNGVYFARLETDAGSKSLKVVQLPR